METKDLKNCKDSFNLKRFETAQEGIYERVLFELKSGCKKTHWMWFIFPEVDGMGSSSVALSFSIKSKEEAVAYLNHVVLGARLLECVRTMLALNGYTAERIFGIPDFKKFRSSMTLFAYASSQGSVFHQVLEKYFDNRSDKDALQLLRCL